MTDSMKYTLDVAAIANVIATLVGWLPAVAAILSIIWTAIQIYSWFNSKP